MNNHDEYATVSEMESFARAGHPIGDTYPGPYASISDKLTVVPDTFVIRNGRSIIATETDPDRAFEILNGLRAADPTGSLTYTLSIDVAGLTRTTLPKE